MRQPKSAKIPPWYVTRTLLGGDPDMNRRTIYHNDIPIATFNERMDEWHQADNRALNSLCNYLNTIASEAA